MNISINRSSFDPLIMLPDRGSLLHPLLLHFSRLVYSSDDAGSFRFVADIACTLFACKHLLAECRICGLKNAKNNRHNIRLKQINLNIRFSYLTKHRLTKRNYFDVCCLYPLENSFPFPSHFGFFHLLVHAHTYMGYLPM